MLCVEFDRHSSQKQGVDGGLELSPDLDIQVAHWLQKCLVDNASRHRHVNERNEEVGYVPLQPSPQQLPTARPPVQQAEGWNQHDGDRFRQQRKSCKQDRDDVHAPVSRLCEAQVENTRRQKERCHQQLRAAADIVDGFGLEAKSTALRNLTASGCRSAVSNWKASNTLMPWRRTLTA